MTHDNGGPMFPGVLQKEIVKFDDPKKLEELKAEVSWVKTRLEGMSWLDYAAIQIMAENCYRWQDSHDMGARESANDSYLLAEALLAEKRKREASE